MEAPASTVIAMVKSTEVLHIYPAPPSLQFIERAASLVRSGGVVIYPTETFYGIGCNPLDEAAVERVYELKGRHFSNPLPLIADGVETVRKLVKRWPTTAGDLAADFWPGPLTMVLQAVEDLPEKLHARTGKIAVRVSSHPIASTLAALSGGAIVSTSANRSGAPPCITIGELPSDLREAVDLVLDAGQLPGGRPSTIVDVTVWPPALLREGAIAWKSILREGMPPLEG